MILRSASSIAGTLLLVALAGVLPADRITLSNGRVIEGRVLQQDETTIRVQANSMVLTLARDTVVSVEKSQPFENSLISAEDAFRRRDIRSGVDLLEQAEREGAPLDRRREIPDKFSTQIVTASEQTNRPEEQRALRLALRSLVDEDLATTRTLFAVARGYRLLGDMDAAAQTVYQIEDGYISSDPIRRQWALDLLRRMVERQLSRGEFESALVHVEKMRRLTGGDNSGQIPLAHLVRAASARDRRDYRAAFTIIVQNLQPEVPEIARNRAVYTIEHLMLWVADSHRYAEARDAVALLANVFPIETAEATDRLLEQEAAWLLESDQPDTIVALIGSIPEQDRTARMTELYNRGYHESRMKIIGPHNPLELYRHAEWCVKAGLLDEALLIFSQTRTNDNLRDVSESTMENVQRERDTRLLQRAQKKFDENALPEAMALAQLVAENPNRRSDLRDEARRLITLSEQTMAREKDAKGVYAEVMFQQAERAFFTQRFEESLNTLNVVFTQYPGTPAAGRASELLPQVLRALELSYLEGRTTRLPNLPDRVPIERIQRSDRLGEEVTALLKALDAASATR